MCRQRPRAGMPSAARSRRSLTCEVRAGRSGVPGSPPRTGRSRPIRRCRAPPGSRSGEPRGSVAAGADGCSASGRARSLMACWYCNGMVIPVAGRGDSEVSAERAEELWTELNPGLRWSALTTEQKHQRILCAAGRVFARDGLDASMPAVAAEAGAGVGSLYRQFPSKHDLLAALVIRRLLQIQQTAAEAAAAPGDHWQALTELLRGAVERNAADDFLGEAWNHVEDHDQVQVAAEATYGAFTRLIDLARAEGGIRSDATAFDVRLLFMAARASRQLH